MKLQKLLVIIDSDDTVQPALERAAWLARQNQAQLHLLAVEYHGGLERLLFDHKRNDKSQNPLMQKRRDWLEERVAPLREEGLSIDVDIRWGKHLYKQVLAKVSELQPDVVFKSASHNGLLRRLFLTDTCWQLIRYCPAPLWLVHQPEWRGQGLCAALDPMHSADKPAALDHRLIETAQYLNQQLELKAHYVHCHAPLPRTLVFDAELIADYDNYVERTQKEHLAAFERLTSQHDIDPADSHLLPGFAEEELPRYVRKHDIGLLLMGAIARDQLETALIGHTAERVLQEVDCDLLVLKTDKTRSQA